MQSLLPPSANYKRCAQRGFTLTELAIVMGVIGAIMGAIWVAAGKVSDNNRTQKAAAEVAQIIAGYKTLFAQHGIDNATAWTDVTCIGVNAGFFPTEMMQSGTACSSGNGATYPLTPWGGSSYVLVNTNQSINTISVYYFNLSQAACMSLANAVFTTATMTYQAIYNGTTWYGNQMINTTNAPWTTTQINGYCGATNSNAVQIGVSAT